MLNQILEALGGEDGIFASLFEGILNATIFKIAYNFERVLCWIISILSQLFRVFAGLDKVVNNGKSDYLINVFFSNKVVSNIYWGMAVIGIVLTFAFAIWAVIKKMFDLDGKQQQSHGQIIGSALKSIFLILGMTLIMNVVLTTTNILMQQIDYIFNDAYHLDEPVNREFTEEEYAAMGRVLATIGNYSMIATNNSRYNVNMCFNDIRPDMYYLEKQGVFNYSYYETDKYGNEIQYWQGVLAEIAKSTDLTKDVKVDVYNAGVSKSITNAMNYLSTNNIIEPKETAKRDYKESEDMYLDRMVFLLGTTAAAKNNEYNLEPAFDDALRGPYYYGEGRSIYNIDHVDSDFNIGFKTDYILVYLAAFAIIFDLVVILLNCVSRIFNMMFLYIIAPPVIAATPLDNGGKFKQWSTAFLVQSLSVFGTVIAMRLTLIYVPIVMSPKLVLFADPYLNIFGKFILIYGGFEAAKRSTSLLTGILADNAGWQAVQAGDMSSSAAGAIGKVTGMAKGIAGKAAGMAGGALSFAARPLTNRIARPFKQAADKWNKMGTGGKQQRAEKQVRDEEAYKKARAEYDKKNKKEKPESKKNNPAPQKKDPPPLPNQFNRPNGGGDDSNVNNVEQRSLRNAQNQRGLGELQGDDRPKPPPKEAPLPTRNRPSLD